MLNGGKWGARTSPAQRGFLSSKGDDIRQLPNGWLSPNLATTRKFMYTQNVQNKFSQHFSFAGHLPPKHIKIDGVGRVSYSDQHRAQGTHCRDIGLLFIPRIVSIAIPSPDSVLYNVGLLFRKYRASNFPNFRIMANFFPYKTPKNTLSCSAFSPRVTLQNGYLCRSGKAKRWFC